VKILKTRILIADDDPVYREVGKEALEQAGFEVTLAADGAQAIEALATQKFHAAALDLTMPEADGIAVIAAVRAGGPNVNTPIVVITGHDDTSAVERAYDAGATSFLTKPLNWLLFTHHMQFILRAGQLEAQLREATQAAAFLSDLKSQMLGALAREFQMPIKTIYGFAELIRREVYGPLMPATYREMAMDMGNAAHKLNSSFLKLMDLGNALSEQLKMKTEAIALRDTVEDVLLSIGDEAERRSVRVDPVIDIPKHVSLEADRVLFIQAVRAIFANAVRLAPHNSKVGIRAWIGDDGGLRIAAADHGPPISASLIAEMKNTDRSRASAAHFDMQTRDVGVKIAKVLAEAHQGSINVHSDGRGANVVRIALPASRLKSRPEKAPPAAVREHEQARRLSEIGAALAQDPRVRFARTAPTPTPTDTSTDTPGAGASTSAPHQAPNNVPAGTQ